MRNSLKGFCCDAVAQIPKNLLPEGIWGHIEALRPALEKRSLDDSQLHFIGGLLAHLGVVIQQLCPAQQELTLSPKQLLGYIIRMNKLIDELRSMYPIQQSGHPTPIVILDCMDSRRNVSGLNLFMDSRHIVDSIATPGAILSDDVIHGIGGAVALHASKIVLLVRHNTCGVGKLATKQTAPASQNAAALVGKFKEYKKHISELAHQPELMERISNGATWLVVAEANTQTGEVSNFHRVTTTDDGIVFEEVTITDIDLVLGRATSSPPAFVTQGCDVP